MAHKQTSGVARQFISSKIAKIQEEGIRRNTKKPVSKSNPRRPVSRAQAIKVAYEMARKRFSGIPAYKHG